MTPARLRKSLAGMTLATQSMLLPVPMASLYATDFSFLGMWVAAAAGILFVIVSSSVSRRATTLFGVQLLLGAAAVAYVISWFFPVFDGSTVPGGLSGWQAMRGVLNPLWDHQRLIESPWFSLLGIVTGLSNVFMIVALINLFFSRLASANRWRRLTLAAAAVNTSWLGMDWPDHDFRIGYYLWLLSFLLLAIAVWPRSVRTGQKGAAGVGKNTGSGGESSRALASP